MNEYLCDFNTFVSHQRRQKVLYISYYFRRQLVFGDNNDYMCDDANHAPNIPIITQNPDLVPRIMSKFINITTLYLCCCVTLEFSKQIKTLPPKLEHLYIYGGLLPEDCEHLISLLTTVDIQHLIVTTVFSNYDDSLTESLLKSCSHLKLFHISSTISNSVQFLPQLTDYACSCMNLSQLRYTEEVKDQFI